jgi:uncharacterized membrane protein
VYRGILFAHLLAAVTWIGGNILFFAAAPRLRAMPDGGPGALRVLGRIFRVLSWGAFALLLVTGAVFLSEGWDWRTWPLSAKLALVGVVLGFKALHDFWIAPQAARKRGSFFTAALWIGRTNLILGLVILYLSVRLRG